VCPLERAGCVSAADLCKLFAAYPPLKLLSRISAPRPTMSRPAIMRGLENCGGRGSSYAKLVEAEPEPVARATPPYDYLEHTEEGKQEKYHHGLCTSHGGAKARLAPGSFYPSTDRDRENGQITRQLGDSLYSAFILIWMNKSSNSNWHTLWFAVKTGLVVSLLASHYAQLSFAYYLINSIRQSHDSGYCAGDDYTPVLKMLAVISFLSLCFGDLQATYDMHLWLSMFKTSKTHEKLEVHRWVDTSNKLVKDTKIYLPLIGITWFARFVFYTLVVIPKVVVAVCVATAGSGLVLRSETDYDLVLNAVAAGFVLDLDEVVYRVFLTCAPASQPWHHRRRRAPCGAVSCIPALSAERPVRRAPQPSQQEHGPMPSARRHAAADTGQLPQVHHRLRLRRVHLGRGRSALHLGGTRLLVLTVRTTSRARHAPHVCRLCCVRAVGCEMRRDMKPHPRRLTLPPLLLVR